MCINNFSIIAIHQVKGTSCNDSCFEMYSIKYRQKKLSENLLKGEWTSNDHSNGTY
jgi:hypothetical protein